MQLGDWNDFIVYFSIIFQTGLNVQLLALLFFFSITTHG